MKHFPARLIRYDFWLLMLLSCVYALVVLTSQSSFRLLNSDYPWYMNRADLMWRGILDDAFVYTATYPFLVGLVNLGVRHLMMASVIVNVVCLIALFGGVYFLGKRHYNRAVAWIAVCLLACNPFMIAYFRQMQTMTLFSAIVVWCMIAYDYQTRHPKIRYAVLLGIGVGIALYTRFEGILYGILFVCLGWQVARHGGRIRWALVLMFVAGVTLLPFFVFFMAVASRGAISSGTDNFVIIALQTIDIGAYVARSIGLSLELTVRIWSVGLWVLTLWALYRFGAEKRATHQWLWGMGIFHAIIVFILTYYPTHVDYYPPIMAYGVLVFGWAIWRIGEQFNKRWGAMGLTTIVCCGTLWASAPAILSERYPFMLFNDPNAVLTVTIDDWLMSNNVQRVWTLCPYTIPYTHIETRYIYRFAGYTEGDQYPDSPVNLLPKMLASGDVFMHCDLNSANDWRDFLDGTTTFDSVLQPLNTFVSSDGSISFRYFRVGSP
jgi:hypothetical protein